MENNKLSDKDLNDILFQSIVLSNILIEKFEIMEENKLLIHKTKHAVKNANKHLNEYIKRVYHAGLSKEETILATDMVLVKQNKIENLLSDRNILIFDDKKALIKKILNENGIHEHLSNKIISDVEKTQLLNG